jgi:hypothetical protein
MQASGTSIRRGLPRVAFDPHPKHYGRRERFPLYTPNKAAAAAKARDIYLFLAANGWEPITSPKRACS